MEQSYKQHMNGMIKNGTTIVHVIPFIVPSSVTKNSSRQYTTFIDSGTNFHCVHVFVVIHRFQKSPTSNAIISTTITIQTVTIKTKNASFFMNFPIYDLFIVFFPSVLVLYIKTLFFYFSFIVYIARHGQRGVRLTQNLRSGPKHKGPPL